MQTTLDVPKSVGSGAYGMPALKIFEISEDDLGDKISFELLGTSNASL